MAKGRQIRKSFREDLVARWHTLEEKYETPNILFEAMLDALESHTTLQDQDTPQATTPAMVLPGDILDALGVPEDERAMVLQVCEEGAVPWKHLFRTAILAEAKHRQKAFDRMEGLDLADAASRQHVRGAGFLRCKQALDELIAANEAAKTQATEKGTSFPNKACRYISRNVLAMQGGLGVAVSKKFYEAYAEEIAAHNRDMGFLTPEQGQLHNQYGPVDERKGKMQGMKV